jgi:hypothetical protein
MHLVGQTHTVPTFTPPPVFCPKCKDPYAQEEDLRRHLLSFHLPCWIFCPYPPCTWRGHREEDFQRHLHDQQCGPNPEREWYEIYITDLVLDWILEGIPVERAATYALDFVAERALELGKVEEWSDLWGDRGKTARRRRMG